LQQHPLQPSVLSFVSEPALVISDFEDLVGASIAQVAVVIGVPPDHPLRPWLLPALLDIILAAPPQAFRR